MNYTAPISQITPPYYGEIAAQGRKRLDITTGRRNVARFVKHLNSQQPDKKQQIRGAVMATLMRICDAYVRQNNYTDTLSDAPVPCRLNNCMLASQLYVNRRTIINHLAKLQKAGLITKKFRGTNADYELTVSAEALLYEEGVTTPCIAKNLLQISLVTNLEISNKHPKGCELVEKGNVIEEISGQPPASAAINTALGLFSGYTLKTGEPAVENQTLSTVQKEKKEGGGGAAAKKFPAWQLAMVTDFYRYAITTLYPIHSFDQDMERKILNKMFSHVYGGFKLATMGRGDWEKYQGQLFERVNMIHQWKERPLPEYKAKEYKEGKYLVNPLTFFDRGCKHGFINTEQWLELRHLRLALFKAALELEKARKEILTGQDRLNTYRKWETRFKNKKLPQAKEMFYKAMADIHRQLVSVKNAPLIH